MLVVILCSLVVTSELLLALATLAMAVMFLSELVRLRTRMLLVAPSGLLEELALPATIVTVEVVNQVATSLWLEPLEMPKALMLLEAFPLQEARAGQACPRGTLAMTMLSPGSGEYFGCLSVCQEECSRRAAGWDTHDSPEARRTRGAA